MGGSDVARMNKLHGHSSMHLLGESGGMLRQENKLSLNLAFHIISIRVSANVCPGVDTTM